jgi:hypothetical protein
MKKALLLISAALISFTACGGQKKQKTDATASSDSLTTIYRMPAIPQLISAPEDQGAWAIEHYWDDFNFADTLTVARWSDYAEQAFVDFTDAILMRAPLDMSTQAISVLFTKAAANKPVSQKFAEVAEKYLFDGNSPLRNEDLYIATLRAVLANPSLDQWERIRPEEQLRLVMKNRPGDRATDFRYTLENGATGTLHGLKAKYTLLFFNNPGCPACKLSMQQIGESQLLSTLIANGTMRVLAVYTDADLNAWREYLPQMPAGWISSYDAGEVVKTQELYDLKAIPTIYLLDRDKRVMLKDEMMIPRIEAAVANAEAGAGAGL